MKRTLAVLVGLLLLGTGYSQWTQVQRVCSRPGERASVMTQNLYVGADLVPIFETNPNDPLAVPIAVANVLSQIKASDFPSRAEMIAREIERREPDLIGLQEVELIRVQSPGDYYSGNPIPARTVVYDYLEILLRALESRGACYVAAVVQNEADVELPALAGYVGGVPVFDDARLTDRNVILSRCGVPITNPGGAHYAVALRAPVLGQTIVFTRGYVAADATVRGRTYRFVNTHLEVNGPVIDPIQAAQARELIRSLANEPLPILLVGDFNSGPLSPPLQPYAQLSRAGYIDVWLHRRGLPSPGFTCCQAADLRNPVSRLNRRIDLIWVRNVPETGYALGPVSAVTVGASRRDRTPGGLWPSDHAGVVANLRLPRPCRDTQSLP